jgi:hypothetical protein
MWFMIKPIQVGVEVSLSREQVYDYLDVISHHESFTDHFLHDFRYSGPDRGVGARLQATATAAGRSDPIQVVVISAERPSKIVERNVGANGRRVATGTYTLGELPEGRTRIDFEYSWEKAPISERLAAPLVRSVMRRANQRALNRLAEQLSQGRAPVSPGAS